MGLNLISRRELIPLMLKVVVVKGRGRSRWERRVVDSSGKASMSGWQGIRPGAKYQGERALFFAIGQF
jgi:hypothetical protein